MYRSDMTFGTFAPLYQLQVALAFGLLSSSLAGL